MPSSRSIRAGHAYVELGVKDKIARGLRGARARLRTFAAGVAGLGAIAAGAGIALGAMAAKAIKSFVTAGDQLDKMSKRTGLAVEFLSKLSHAAQIGGTDIETFEKALRRLQRSAVDANRDLSTQVEAFEALDVQWAKADGTLKSTELLFLEVAGALGEMTNETEKAGLAQMLFGRSGTALLPMLKQGEQGLRAMMHEAERLGLVMSTKDATAAAELNDRMTRLNAVFKMTVFHLASELEPAVSDAADALLAWSQGPGGKAAFEGMSDAIRELIFHLKEIGPTGELAALTIERAFAKVAQHPIFGSQIWRLLGRDVKSVEADIHRATKRLADARNRWVREQKRPGGGPLPGLPVPEAGAPGAGGEGVEDATGRALDALRNTRRELDALSRQQKVSLLEAMGLEPEAEFARIDADLRSAKAHLEDLIDPLVKSGDILQLDLSAIKALVDGYEELAAQRRAQAAIKFDFAWMDEASRAEMEQLAGITPGATVTFSARVARSLGAMPGKRLAERQTALLTNIGEHTQRTATAVENLTLR